VWLDAVWRRERCVLEERTMEMAREERTEGGRSFLRYDVITRIPLPGFCGRAWRWVLTNRWKFEGLPALSVEKPGFSETLKGSRRLGAVFGRTPAAIDVVQGARNNLGVLSDRQPGLGSDRRGHVAGE
jgi:hypothetical protein